MTLYNHYIRDKNGNYIRVSAEEPSVEYIHIPQAHEAKKTIQTSAEAAPISEHMKSSIKSDPFQRGSSQQRLPESQFANKLLGHLNLSDIDSGDLLLLALLFFLFRQNADEELLIALGLLLVM